MKLHPLFEDYLISGTLTFKKDVSYTFDEWMEKRVWSVKPLRVTKLTPHFQDLYSLLFDLGFRIDRITGCFSPPNSKVVYRGFDDDINCIVYHLFYVPAVYRGAMFSSYDADYNDHIPC